MDVKSLSLTISGYQLIDLPTGLFALDGGAMFGSVPKVLWEKTNPADSKNRISMEARSLCLKSQNRIILIDTGNGSDFIEKYGEKLGSKFSELYGTNSSFGLLDQLKVNNISPDDITDVILTHLHFDHAGGATCFKDGNIVPTFKNAKYYVQKSNLETARQPNIREKASYLESNFMPLIEHNVLEVLDGPIQNLFPGIDVQITNGHTQGQQIIKISDSESGIFYCADLIPTSSHVRLAWVMGYDLNALTVIDEKKRVLEEAAQNGYYLYYEHDPYCSLSKVEFEKNDYRSTEKYRLK